MTWTEKFVNMLFPFEGDKAEIEGAYLFKDKYLPTTIFKYREINQYSIKNLEEDTIWLSDPSNFNDSYDCGLSINFETISENSTAKHMEMYFKERTAKKKDTRIK